MILYYLWKIRATIKLFYYRRRLSFKYKDGLVYGGLGKNFSFSNQVSFAFWNSDLVHLGDQLFYLPLMKAL
ncbi:hypothetical protein DID77_03680, partial [Candidatus Marinamargulisbacteria bacterium SCGC AG-439-L15]